MMLKILKTKIQATTYQEIKKRMTKEEKKITNTSFRQVEFKTEGMGWDKIYHVSLQKVNSIMKEQWLCIIVL